MIRVSNEIMGLTFSPDGKSMITATWGHNLSLWEMASGQLVRSFTAETASFSPDNRLIALVGVGLSFQELYSGQIVGNHPKCRCWTGAFSRDGKRFAAGTADTTVLIWDTAYPKRSENLTRTPTQRWNTLTTGSAAQAYPVIGELIASPGPAIEFLTLRLQPVQPLAADRVRPLITQLNSNRFADREKAFATLAGFGIRAEAELRTALALKPPPETRMRLRKLIHRIDTQLQDPNNEELGHVRAIQVLEGIGNMEARRLLRWLADGVPHAPRTEDARAALRRLGARE